MEKQNQKGNQSSQQNQQSGKGNQQTRPNQQNQQQGQSKRDDMPNTGRTKHVTSDQFEDDDEESTSRTGKGQSSKSSKGI